MAGTFFAPRYWVSDYWLTDYFGGEEQPAGSIAANLSSAVSVAAQLSGIGAASADLAASFAVSGALEGAAPTGDMSAMLAFGVGLTAEIIYTGTVVQRPVIVGGGEWIGLRPRRPVKPVNAAAELSATVNLSAAISGAENTQAEMSGAVTLTGTLTIDMTQTQMDNDFWLMAA